MTLLSLFDYSGNWSLPFALGGWEVIQWDIKLAAFMDINLIKNAEIALDLFENIDGILAAPPCTEFTVSGAQYWGAKDKSGVTAKAVQLVNQVQRLSNLFRPTDDDYEQPFFWAVENPVGRMATLTGLGKAVYFNPFEYAGYLPIKKRELVALERIREKNGMNVTHEENALVLKCNAYTKKTGLWGEFIMPEKKIIPPVKTAAQGSFTQRLGGKSDKTKELRSNTPMGFAHAFYEANKGYCCHLKQVA